VKKKKLCNLQKKNKPENGVTLGEVGASTGERGKHPITKPEWGISQKQKEEEEGKNHWGFPFIFAKGLELGKGILLREGTT